jgi:hypothetical protein
MEIRSFAFCPSVVVIAQEEVLGCRSGHVDGDRVEVVVWFAATTDET